jgi:tetratricopeptide (TPR) repeat protein
VVEVVRQAAAIGDGDSADVALAKVTALVESEDDADLVAARVGQVVGLVADSAVPEETFWGIRRLLEAVAHRRPLVVLFDDVHWAEPTFLDLIEHLADWSRDAPLLVVCLGRQELLDQRPGWGGGKLNATSMLLEPLSEGECGALLENLLGRSDAVDEARARITDAAEGNPLFVEEMLAMLIDDGVLRQSDGGWALAGDLAAVSVPPTIQALLAARLDRLDHEERAVIGPASVVGRVFYRGAVAEMAPEPLRPQVGAHLMTLVRRELIRPHPAEFRGEDTYRFRHILIRDAAYDAMPKEVRAALHERFASWLEAAAGERLREFEEIVGYHLEQAHRYHAELGPLDEAGRSVGERAGRFLAAPGRRALARGDVRGAVGLLTRAVTLLRPRDPDRLEVLTELGWALQTAGELDRSGNVLSEALEAAGEIGDLRSELRARMGQISLRISTDPTTPFAWALEEMERLFQRADQLGDDALRIEALHELGQIRFWSGRAASAIEAYEQGLAIVERSGSSQRRHSLYAGIGGAMMWGPTPVADAMAWWEPVLQQGGGGAMELFAYGVLSVMHAMAGHRDRALELNRRHHTLMEDLGTKLFLAAGHIEGLVFVLVGDLSAAESVLAEGIEVLRSMGETGFLSTSAAALAEVRFNLDRDDEALEASRLSEQLAAPDDVASQSGWRSVRGRILARWGRADEAEALAREAVEIIDATDHLTFRGDARRSLGETLMLLGRSDEARIELGEAIGLYEAKGNVVMGERTRAMIRGPGAATEA